MDEQFLVDVLCRVREIWWPNVSKMNCEYYGYYFGEYGTYVQQYWQDDKLNKKMDEDFLRKASEWRMLPLEEILEELRSYPLFNKLLTRYWGFAKAYLCDIDSRYKELTEVNPQHIADATGAVCIYSPGTIFEKQLLFHGERGATDKVLLERMLAIQEVRGMMQWRPDSETMEGPKMLDEDPLFVALNEVFEAADQEKKEKIIRFMPGNAPKGKPKKGAVKKEDFMEELQVECKNIDEKITQQGDTFRKRFDSWAKQYHPDLIQNLD